MHLLNSLNIGILIIDKESTVKFCNRWLEKRLGDGSPIKTGAALNKVFNLDEYSRLKNAIDQASKHARATLISEKLNPLPFKLLSGKTKLSYNLCVTPLTLKSEDDKSVMIQFLDVTQVKSRENYLKKKQEEMDKQREVSFNQERLASLGQLTSSIAHEINNPLMILQSGNYILSKQFKKEAIDIEKCEKIIRENEATIKRMTNLIDGIRNLSRSPSTDDFEMISLATIFDDLVPVFNNLFKGNNIELRVDTEDPLCQMEIPLLRVLISQVFINLLNNSIYEIQNQEDPWIEIKFKEDEKNLIISFVDSGHGIPKEVQSKIFLPFYTTKDIGKGTGLGLSTIAKIIENHDGKLWIDNDSPNTCFMLRFPKERGSAQAS